MWLASSSVLWASQVRHLEIAGGQLATCSGGRTHIVEHGTADSAASTDSAASMTSVDKPGNITTTTSAKGSQ